MISVLAVPKLLCFCGGPGYRAERLFSPLYLFHTCTLWEFLIILSFGSYDLTVVIYHYPMPLMRLPRRRGRGAICIQPYAYGIKRVFLLSRPMISNVLTICNFTRKKAHTVYFSRNVVVNHPVWCVMLVVYPLKTRLLKHEHFGSDRFSVVCLTHRSDIHLCLRHSCPCLYLCNVALVFETFTMSSCTDKLYFLFFFLFLQVIVF